MSQGPALHFLHTESRASLGLVDQQGNRKKQITAEVVDKEYCQVKLNTPSPYLTISDPTHVVGEES